MGTGCISLTKNCIIFSNTIATTISLYLVDPFINAVSQEYYAREEREESLNSRGPSWRSRSEKEISRARNTEPARFSHKSARSRKRCKRYIPRARGAKGKRKGGERERCTKRITRSC